MLEPGGGTSREATDRKERERKMSMVMTIVFFIIGLSIVLSYNWGAPEPGFKPESGLVILFGIFVSAIIYIAAMYTTKGPGALGFGLRFCPECGRQIQFNATQCPYCGHRLP